MSGSALSKKLRLQAGQRILILNAPEGYRRALGLLPEGVELVDELEEGLDFVHLFVKDVAELEELAPVAIEAVRHDGLLWISYPKRSSGVETDISRDEGWEVVAGAGLRPVTQVRIDDTWSALRFRPDGSVGKRA